MPKPSTLALAICLLATPTNAEPQTTSVFEDDFAVDEISAGWHWLREDPSGWKVIDGKLHMRTNGTLWNARNTQKNILLHAEPMADDPWEAQVTVNGSQAMTGTYEHVGLIWYVDDDNWVTLTQLNHVEDQTQKIILVHEESGRGRDQASRATPYTGAQVDLRLVVEDGAFVGFFRANAKESWQRLGAISWPTTADRRGRVGLVAGEGDDLGHWVTLDDVQIRSKVQPLAEALNNPDR